MGSDGMAVIHTYKTTIPYKIIPYTLSMVWLRGQDEAARRCCRLERRCVAGQP